MGVKDLVVLVCGPEYELPWSLVRGRETFFDEDNVQRRWATAAEAARWAEDNLGVSPLDHLPEGARERSRAMNRRERLEDLPLFAKGESAS